MKLKIALAAAILVAGCSLATNILVLNRINHPTVLVVQVQPTPEMLKKAAYTNIVLRKYKVDEDLVSNVVEYAHKYEGEKFPKAHQLLAVVGVESSWRPHVKSKLRTDPAYGLTQIRLETWAELIGTSDISDPEMQIKYASLILQEYYSKLKSERAAVLAYNSGINSYRKGKFDTKYWIKYNNEVTRLKAFDRV